MKSLKSLHSLLQDASVSTGADMTRDWKTIQSRLQHEGLSFLTITLPAFASWLEQSFEAGHTLPTILPLFKRVRNRTYPCFMQGLVKRVFDYRTGDLLSEADPLAVFFIRTICTKFKKTKLPCTKVRNDAAVKKFVDTDDTLPEHIELDNITQSVAYVVLDSLRFFEADDSYPRHGKGATVEKVTGNRKYSIREFYERWINVIDPEELYGVNRIGDRDITTVSLNEEKPCKLKLVPKTLKSPRIIAVEPVVMQSAQQLCAERLISSMRKSSLTRHIDFTDQTVNRRAAEKGSRDGSIATIDLSEASDRISLALVNAVFKTESVLLENILAFRSSRVELTAGPPFNRKVIRLKKYATSGSALTFPVETLVFFILSLSAIVQCRHKSYPSLRAAISSLAQTVNVYGDDIVVPADTCSQVMAHLEAQGLKVNRNKTFWKGPFRESCGGDYFRGHDVTPVYLKHDMPTDLTRADMFESAVASANLYTIKGCWNAAHAIREMVDAVFKLPTVLPTCPGLGWIDSFNPKRPSYDKVKVRKKDGNWIVRTLVSRTRPVKDEITGYDALLKHYLSRGVQEDKDHLHQTTPRYRSRLSIKWVTPY